ncbi:MAG TPA: helix-turn-helix domain-containing protein [Candidatus Binatia bacterium]|nr:helix-turn-helix domain-containing protein [Candidatus Binatia bacterium]
MQRQRFRDLGFTQGEEKVYIALLKLGSVTSGRLASESGVSRSKLYEVLEKLVKKGLVSRITRNRVTHFSPAPPVRILDYLQEREEGMRQQRAAFEKALPSFERLIGQAPLHVPVEFFEGAEGIRTMRETLLSNTKPGDILYFFGKSATGHKHMFGYWDEFTERRVKKKVWSYDIYNQDAREWAEKRKDAPYTKIRYFPTAGETPAWVGIWGDTVVITTRKDKQLSLALHDKNVAQSFKTYFDLLWNIAVEKLPV